jgi:cytochrome c oxidase subunit 3
VSTEVAAHEVEAFSFLGMSWKKVMMWIFIITDALLFAGYLASYGYARIAAGAWPDQREVFHLWFISLMTFVLISSSATMACAVAAARVRDKATASKMVLATVVGGTLFLGMQAFEWTTLIREGVSLTQNPWNIPAFGNYFFLVTGFHGTHVLIGVIILVTTLVRVSRGVISDEGVEMAGLYWHFVDLVWVFIFTLFYLI